MFPIMVPPTHPFGNRLWNHEINLTIHFGVENSSCPPIFGGKHPCGFLLDLLHLTLDLVIFC